MAAEDLPLSGCLLSWTEQKLGMNLQETRGHTKHVHLSVLLLVFTQNVATTQSERKWMLTDQESQTKPNKRKNACEFVYVAFPRWGAIAFSIFIM
jgi:hypothetical protein